MQAQNRFTIETARLTLVCCDKEILQALLESDEALAKLLGVSIPERWTEFSNPQWTYDRITKDGLSEKWLGYLPVLKAENLLVGSCGFKGDPKNGVVEIGYEVAPDHRCKGLATEMATALIKFALEHNEVTKVQAHTLAAENESGSVLKKCGMQKVEELEDPEDGTVWRWEVNK